jgi:two-component system, OmpR family, sensor histidine kinase KdpD
MHRPITPYGRSVSTTIRSPDEQIKREARVVGLRDISTPSLEAVERRRLQLWAVTVVLLLAVSVGVAVLSTLRGAPGGAVVTPSALRVAVILLSLGFGGYALEKELHLRKLSRLLLDERVLTTALTNRLHEVSLLLDAGKAMNSVLELPAVLETILRSAMDLLDARSGSIMLLEKPDELVVVLARGNEAAVGGRVRVGSGIAGRVAQTREALLIDGRADKSSFPGLSEREEEVESALSVPLVNRNVLFGVLNVNAGPDRQYSEYDLRALSLFAEQAAVAIANSRLYETERQHVAQLLELDRMKTELGAFVTHELKTPITTILGAAESLKRRGMHENAPELLQMVESQARRLTGMVNELQAATKLEEGRESIIPEPVDLAMIVRDAAADAKVAGREVDVEAPDELLVLADSDSLRHIVDNLIDNAHKHGGAPVRAIVERMGDEVILSVVDSGPGVPEEDRERIFDRFQRLERDRPHPGLGLGLPIVRSLTEACRGRVWVDEAPMGGAAFRVALRQSARKAKTA